MSHPADHIHDSLQFIAEHWAQLSLIAGAGAGLLVWLANSVLSRYATVKAVNELKDSNRDQHDRILAQVNGNHAELLRTILDLHKDERGSNNG